MFTKFDQFKGGVILHLRNPKLAKEAGTKGGKTTADKNPHLKTSEHGKWLASQRKNGFKNYTYQYEISDLCIQCDQPNPNVESFCSKNCRIRFNRRVKYFQQTYGLSRVEAINLIEARRTSKEIIEIGNKTTKRRTHDGPPYTHRPKISTS
jgi:hypothetical protein